MLAAALVALLAVPACTQPDQDTIRVASERHLDYGPFAPYSGVLSSRQGAELPTALPEGFEPTETLALDPQQEVALARAARLGTTDTSAASNLEHSGLSSAAIDVLAERRPIHSSSLYRALEGMGCGSSSTPTTTRTLPMRA